MEDLQTRAKRRLNIIQWHAAVCLDGGDNRSAAWKSKLAERIGVSASTITNMCAKETKEGRKRQRSVTIEKLGRLEDEEFEAALGFKGEASVPADQVEYKQRLLRSFHSAASEDDYADACLLAKLSLKEEKRILAERRIVRRAERDRDREARWRTKDKAYWRQQPGNYEWDNAKPVVPMHASENTSVAGLFDVLVNGLPSSAATILHARPYSGTAYALQRLLPDQNGFELSYGGGIHHLHMDALEYLHDVRKILGQKILSPHDPEISGSTDGPVAQRLASYLHLQSQLLIIHGATAIPEKSRRFIDTLADELASNAKTRWNKHVSRLLLTCWDRDSFAHLNNSRPRRFEYQPTIESNEAMPYFGAALDYYLDLRRRETKVEAGLHAHLDSSLIKRVAHHYSARSYPPYTEMPSAVRFRAFCASDVDGPSPFDPTQGVWKRVDEELRRQIPEIASCLGDVQSDIRAYRNVGQASDLTTLRLISTSLFFFSETMLAKLKAHRLSKPFVEDVSLESLVARRNYVLIWRQNNGDRIATMPLLVRSLIQDDWARYQPASRCAVHEAIADVLYEMAALATQGTLENELPYTPPRGDERLAFALEAIRHFMRAAASAEQENRERLTRRALDTYDQFLESKVFPSRVVDKDPSTPKISSQRLSRVHGLLSLKFEVLCLMSGDGRGMQAPRGIDGQSRIAFFREIGICLTRMLRPKEAVHAFDTALGATGLSSFDKSHLLAHAISTYISLGNIENANTLLAEARAIERSENLDYDIRETIKGRNDAREAAIVLGDGDADRSAVLWANLADKDLVAFWSDRAIGYIDAHLASGKAWDKHSQTVWRVVEQAANRAYNEGFEDERLRINVRRAAIARRLGYPEVAEAILDQIGLDLGRHGGSELVFREFQYESAATLAALSRPRYAFAAYAWPAYQALRQSTAAPWAKRARQQCEALLNSIHLAVDEELPALEAHPFWIQSEKDDLSLAHPFFSVDLLPPIEEVRAVFLELVDDLEARRFRTFLKNEDLHPPDVGVGARIPVDLDLRA